MKIAISSSESRFSRYTDWLEYNNTDYEILNFKSSEEDLVKLNTCSGLLLTGGIDIYPELYGSREKPDIKETYNTERDKFEIKLLEKALEIQIPVFGICRGLQLINVFLGGSLIFDIEQARNVSHRKISPNKDRMHIIHIVKDSMLHEIIGLDETEVNSSHHQAIDRVGEGLMISAKSVDGIIEGIEFADKTNNPFLIGVQWHPERMHDLNHPAAINILNRFVTECNTVKVKN